MTTAAPPSATIARASHLAEIPPAPEAGGAGHWVHLLPAGRFQGRDGRGPYVLRDAAAVIAASMQRGLDPVIDRDHATDYAPLGTSVPAAGWIKEMELRPDGLWGRVEWTRQAAQQIADREYRYLSPVFDYATRDGEVLVILRAALTNNPNLNLTAICANSRAARRNDEVDMDLKELAKALGLAETANQAQVTEAASATHKAAALKRVAQAAGLKEEAAADEIVAAVERAIAAAKAGGTVDPAKYVPVEQVTTLQSRLNALEEKSAAEEVDRAVAAGLIQPALKEWALDYRKRDAQGFQSYLSKQTPTSLHAALVPAAPPASGDKGRSLNAADVYAARAKACDAR